MISETCVSRDSMLYVASTFVNTSFAINSYHINDPYNECPGRIKPTYLSTPGPPPGVSYSYNLWDSVYQFNTFMNGGNNGKFAGDRSGEYRSCARGMNGYESTTYSFYDRAVYNYRSFASISDYKPRSYYEACNKIRLPIIRKDEMYLKSSTPLSDPYPPPTPYP
jgi:hypothetical protein